MLGLTIVFLIGMYLRGTWADTQAYNPRTAAEGPITHLYRDEQGVQVRGAIVVEAPASKVWAVIRDYASHAEFLPYMSAITAEPKGTDRIYLRGTVHSRVWGDWPFAMHVDHKAGSAKEYIASWDEPGEGLAVNRGSWTVTSIGADQTLVVLSLQVEASSYPNFFVRNLLLDRLSRVVRGLRDEVHKRQAGT